MKLFETFGHLYMSLTQRRFRRFAAEHAAFIPAIVMVRHASKRRTRYGDPLVLTAARSVHLGTRDASLRA